MVVVSTVSPQEEVRTFVRNNQDLLSEVLRYSQDPYARACALVLLKRGGTERELEAIEEDFDRVRDRVE